MPRECREPHRLERVHVAHSAVDHDPAASADRRRARDHLADVPGRRPPRVHDEHVALGEVLEPLALADVDEARHDPDDPSLVVLERHGVDEQPAIRAVDTRDAHGEVPDGLAGARRQRSGRLGQRQRRAVLARPSERGHPHAVAAWLEVGPQDALRRRVHENDASPGVADDDPAGHGLIECGEALVLAGYDDRGRRPIRASLPHATSWATPRLRKHRRMMPRGPRRRQPPAGPKASRSPSATPSAARGRGLSPSPPDTRRARPRRTGCPVRWTRRGHRR